MNTLMLALQVGAIIEDIIGRFAAGECVTTSEVMVMTWVQRKPGISGSEIAWQLARDRSNIQRTLKKLERCRWVEKDQDPTKPRSVGWYLTDKGLQKFEVLNRMFTAHEELLGHRLPQLRRMNDQLCEIADFLSWAKGTRSWDRLYERPPPNQFVGHRQHPDADRRGARGDEGEFDEVASGDEGAFEHVASGDEGEFDDVASGDEEPS